MLVRLWALPADAIRRVVDEFDLPRQLSVSDTTDDVVSAFPPNLHTLGWNSVASMVRQLRQAPALSLAVSKIPWHYPWVGRWCGRDSDLFFVFCKHYHILMEEFLLPDTPLAQKARAPGFVLVQAQVLSVLDSTIRRQGNGDQLGGPQSITFDDVLKGADVSAAALPSMPSSNVTRLMGENRLIMLLRDFLAERPSDYDNARQTFAMSFGAMMRASARRTSLFNHGACFILCDFLEEALPIFIRYNNYALCAVEIDWSFWLDVCRKILESENSMSDIRLFSFIFSMWNFIAVDEQRKSVLCLDWLLEEQTFGKFFNHWCPMVRAYYMRLLIWRVCRLDGEPSLLET